MSTVLYNKTNIHFDSVVLDGHNDTMVKVIDEESWLPKIDIGHSTNFHIDIGKLSNGGLNAPFFSAFSSGYYNNNPKNISRTLALINALYWTEKNNKDDIKITSSVDSIKRTVKNGKIAAVPTIEGGYSINNDNYSELLKQYFDLGVRVLGFTWNYSNDLGEGASGVYSDDFKTKSPKGLTNLGKKVVQDMNKMGMVIDISHLSEASFWDTIEMSKAPVLASHSGVYELKEHPRNLNDKQLKALADNGGVIGIVFSTAFLTVNDKAYVVDLVDHIDYVVNLVGINHVALGSDFDGTMIPEDLKDSSELYKVTDELIARNYKKEDIKKILGENYLSVLKKTENKKKVLNKEDKVGIIPELEMGENIRSSTPKLNAEIKNNNKIKDLEYYIIVDGISYKGEFEHSQSNLFLEIEQPLKERFHVVTFEARNKKTVNRETIIFYIKDH